jgi:hypothetical protein
MKKETNLELGRELCMIAWRKTVGFQECRSFNLLHKPKNKKKNHSAWIVNPQLQLLEIPLLSPIFQAIDVLFCSKNPNLLLFY